MIPIARPVIGDDEIRAVTAVLKSGILAQGKRVEEFEEAFARFIGTKYAVAVNSGTAALHIALLAHGIGEGDEVITSPFTFIASANSILFTGARPVFADIEKDTFNIDPDKIEQLLKSKPRPRSQSQSQSKSQSQSQSRVAALLPVHLYGQPCDMNRIMQIAQEHGLTVIEDACQAHGATYCAQPTSTNSNESPRVSICLYQSPLLSINSSNSTNSANSRNSADAFQMRQSAGLC